MFIFSRRSKVILECFTHAEYIHMFTPIKPASEFVPKWFTNMKARYKEPTDLAEVSTIKKCPAVTNMILSGYIIPMWCDLLIKVFKNQQGIPAYQYQFADKKSVASDHGIQQWGAFWDADTKAHIKLVSPWRIKTKDEIRFVWQHPYYHDTHPEVEAVPAIDEFKFQNSTNINLMLNADRDHEIIIKHNTPLVHMIPMTEKVVELKTKLVSEDEWQKIQNMKFFTFQNAYKINRDKAKCPFHKNTY